MKTVRLGDQLEAQLDEIAQSTGSTVSEIIREAVRRHCETFTSDRLSDRLADVVGAVSSGQGPLDDGGQSRRTGRQFTDLVGQKHTDYKNRCNQKRPSK